MTLIFRDPPADSGRRTRGAAQTFVAALAEHPGRWAVYSDGMTEKAAKGFVSRSRARFPHVDWRAAPEVLSDKWSVYGCHRVQ